uniref:Guanine nucleotide-binding protein alpha subunit n=1 Tax=Vitis vinifera TaxID=29760 RepID=A5B5R4_VITVI|nr:hypothetical protein VITISV_008553 [Vitis vinifera]
MGSICSRHKHYHEADAEENAQIKLLFQTGFDEAELKSYISVVHANVYQTIKVLYDGSRELAQNTTDSSKYALSIENKDIGEKLSEIGGRLDYPRLTRELANEIETLWKDAAIQETYSRGNELQVPDCAHYFMDNLERLSDANYVPTKEDVLYARIRTTGVVEIQFSPVGENKKSGEVYRLFDVGGQRNERRKWIHLFEGVTAVIFCAAISEYDQTLFEDENKNRMMETKELFEWVLKQPCFQVPLNVCEWFKDYQPVSTGKQEIEHAYEFVKKKFEELYFQSTAPDCVDRVFKIYRTTALDQKLVKKTFKLSRSPEFVFPALHVLQVELLRHRLSGSFREDLLAETGDFGLAWPPGWKRREEGLLGLGLKCGVKAGLDMGFDPESDPYRI